MTKLSKIDIERLKQMQKTLSDIAESIDEISTRQEYHIQSLIANVSRKINWSANEISNLTEIAK